MKTLYAAASLLALSQLLGCTTTVDDVHHFATQNIGTSLTMVTSSSQLIITNPDGSICVGPPPDATADMGFSAGVSVFSGAGTDGASGNEEEVPLGGRTANVLVTRDMLFQSCLAEARLNLTPDERKAHHQALLDALVKINSQTLDGEERGESSQVGDETVD